ncbi:MAG: hypothetical protein IPN66_09380 [Candidatus Competibacteraceae bacterium]|nr:hypothetical protein [Candidatus Competibacteraceae bacterium]
MLDLRLTDFTFPPICIWKAPTNPSGFGFQSCAAGVGGDTREVAPYQENGLTHGFTVDAHGPQDIEKSLGNVG